jgi:hypothetical protein
VEHLLAALVGLGVDNALIEIDGAEVPVMDGSAEAFAEAIDQAGIDVQRSMKRFIRIRKPVRIEVGSSFAEFRPYDGSRFEIAIAYDCPVIGEQAIALDLNPQSFRKDVARARTFGHMKDVERLWANGFALGSSLENSSSSGMAGWSIPRASATRTSSCGTSCLTHRRSGARRCADPGSLPFLQGRSQAESAGALHPSVAAGRLDDGFRPCGAGASSGEPGRPSVRPVRPGLRTRGSLIRSHQASVTARPSFDVNALTRWLRPLSRD